jgi:hypothetical protein
MYARSILALLNNRTMGLYLDESLQDEYDAMLRSILQDNRRMKGCFGGSMCVLLAEREDVLARDSKYLSASSPHLAMTTSN